MTAKTGTRLIAWLKANPDRASVALGGNLRAAAALFQREPWTHFIMVPDRGYPLPHPPRITAGGDGLKDNSRKQRRTRAQ
jgi:hypothetical protein